MLRSRSSLARRRLATFAACILAFCPLSIEAPSAHAQPGGPILLGGPNVGISGTPFTWDPAAMPIHYRVDPGPMSTSSGNVVVSNAQGVARLNSMFSTWANVPTAALSVENDGALLPSGSYTGGPVVDGSNDLANFNALMQSCDNAQQNPMIFDPNGELASDLGLSLDIVGFDFPCSQDNAGHLKGSGIFLEGLFQSGQYNVSANEFNQAITHEIGHFLGLDHSQINVDVLAQAALSCNSVEVEALPVMFPFLFCQDRVTSGFPALAPDDAAWISRLYPVTVSASGKTITASAYGTISGVVYFTDGITQAQGVNVIARSVNNPQGVAFSVVSGYQFTSSLGQSLTCAVETDSCPSTASQFGSHDTRLAGSFDIPVLPGTYTVQVESVYAEFTGGSGVGPLRTPPIAMPGTAPPAVQVSVAAGSTALTNVTLLGTPPTFDEFETSASDFTARDPLWLWRRRDNLLLETSAQ